MSNKRQKIEDSESANLGAPNELQLTVKTEAGKTACKISISRFALINDVKIQIQHAVKDLGIEFACLCLQKGATGKVPAAWGHFDVERMWPVLKDGISIQKSGLSSGSILTVSKYASGQKQARDMTSIVSEEPLSFVCSYLDAKDLLSTGVVSKVLFPLSQTDALWKQLCSIKWPNVASLKLPSFKDHYMNRLDKVAVPLPSVPKLSLENLTLLLDVSVTIEGVKTKLCSQGQPMTSMINGSILASWEVDRDLCRTMLRPGGGGGGVHTMAVNSLIVEALVLRSTDSKFAQLHPGGNCEVQVEEGLTAWMIDTYGSVLMQPAWFGQSYSDYVPFLEARFCFALPKPEPLPAYLTETWACTACTFINPVADHMFQAQQCTLCLSPRPMPPQLAPMFLPAAAQVPPSVRMSLDLMFTIGTTEDSESIDSADVLLRALDSAHWK
jgi:hypothetical protein